MKKQKSRAKSVHLKDLPAPRSNNILPKIIIVAVILGIMIFIGFYYRSTFVGKAITPSPEPINLNEFKSDDFYFLDIGQQEYNLTLSKDLEAMTPKKILLEAKETENGMVAYTISGANIAKTFGLLNEDLPETGPLYLDYDDLPDVELTLSENVLDIKNLNFISPDSAKMIALDAKWNKVDGNILYAEFNQSVIYYINVTSSSKPDITAAYWEDATLVDYVVNTTGDKFVTLMFNETFDIKKPEIMTLAAEVVEEITQKKFIFAVDGLVYQLDQIHYPKITLTQDSKGMFSATYFFDQPKTGEKDLQPFALLCGSLNLNNIPGKENIKSIFSYEAGIQQWKEGAPSEFQTLVTNKGYLLRLNESGKNFTLTVNCGNNKPISVLPALDKTWNLVGISDYEPVWYDELIKKVPKNKNVTFYDFSLIGPVKQDSKDQFGPGKVYWIKVE